MPPHRFSERQGYAPPDAEITVRADAPYELRGAVVDIAYEAGLGPSTVRSIVCRLLRIREDMNNWSDPNVDGEVREIVDSCAWYEVYDIIEAIHANLSRRSFPGGQQDPDRFAGELNKYFRRQGIGWQLRDGQIEIRGPEVFESSVREAARRLDASGRKLAAKELHEALVDLSRRPDADVTGAIQHAMAALECAARDVTGDQKLTLGAWVSKNRDRLPSPLDHVVEKLWGYTSEQGRHLREGRPPTFDEAELVVGLVGALSAYLARKA